MDQNRDLLLLAKGISFHYPGTLRNTFENLSLVIHNEEIVGVLGESGSGKTTLLKLLAGLEDPTSGVIDRKCRTTGSFVFQAPVLLDWLNVEQNILFPHHGDKNDGEYLSQLLSDLELELDRKKYPRELSGGMRSRVQLARALYRKPRILFLDEAFSSLDEKLRYQLNLLIKRLRERYSFSAVMISHSVHEAVFLSDRLLILRKALDGSTRIVEVSDGLEFSRSSQDVWDSLNFGSKVASVRQQLLDG